MEGAEVATGAGLVGADLGFGTRSAMETGGAEPGIDIHQGTGGAHLRGELEGALGTTVTHRAAIEHNRWNVGQIDGHEELVVGNGTHIIKSCVRTGDAQKVAVESGSYAGGDMAWSLSQQQPLGTELPQGGLLIPAQGTIIPVGFDEGVARSQALDLFGGTGEADVDGFGQMGRETVGKCQLGSMSLLRRCTWIGGAVWVLYDLLAVEHHIYLVATLAVLQSIGIYL